MLNNWDISINRHFYFISKSQNLGRSKNELTGKPKLNHFGSTTEIKYEFIYNQVDHHREPP